MKKLAAIGLSLFLMSGTAIADTPKDSTKDAATEATKATAKPMEAKTNAELAAQMEELRQSLQAQQEELQLLKEELARRDRQIEEAREAAATANARATDASAKATEAVATSAEVKTTTTALNTTVNNLEASNAAVLKTGGASTRSPDTGKSGDGPAAIKYKGISLTPGGFLAAETVDRSHATSSDINTPFTSIPYPGNSLAKVSEFNASGRQSRLTLLVQGDAGSIKLKGYYEGDFLGSGTTSNNRQSNSYVFRQRQAFASASLESGWTFSGGQMWSLASEYKKGLQNLDESLPLQIDAQFLVGFTLSRAYGFRVVKTLNDKFSAGVSVEGSQATIGGRGFSAYTNTTATGVATASQNFWLDAPGTNGGLYNVTDATGYTPNKAPDFIAKLAADPGFGHYELFGILSQFRNRIYPCAVVAPAANATTTVTGPALTLCPDATVAAPSAEDAYNDSRTGGGMGASLAVPVVAKKLDFSLKVLAGDGIGRYGSAQLADMTARPDGTMALIRNQQSLAKLEWHVTPKVVLFSYFGNEYAWRTAYTGYESVTITNTPAIPANGANPAYPATTTAKTSITGIGGYGSPFANNSQCSLEKTPSATGTPSTGGTCAGDIKNIIEGTLGFWNKIYQGPQGRLQWGVQYSYLEKFGWSGNNNSTAPGAQVAPRAVDNMVFTSFRYYLP